MQTRQIAKLCACCLGIIIFSTTTAYDLSALPQLEEYSHTPHQQEVLQKITKADVVYLGEIHSSPSDHQAELDIIQQLYQHHQSIAIAMEMFQRPYQNILDQYLAGKITETQLVEQTQYNLRWGFPWEYYAPILRFAKEHHLPVLAVNTPTEVTHQVAREGLESLTPTQLKYIPPISEIRTDNQEYRQISQQVYEMHHQTGQGNSTNFERFFTAQVLWDETMADAIAQFLKTNPDYQVVVLAGQAHIAYGYGIPSRVARRFDIVTGKRQLVQRSVLLTPTEDGSSGKGKPITDFNWEEDD